MMYIFFACFLLYPLLVRTSTVPVAYDNSYSSGGQTYFHGKCVVALPSFQAKGSWSMRITLNRETTNFKIWDMETPTSEQNGKIYNMQSKYDKSGTVTVRFQMNYIGSTTEYPTGTCENAFNGQTLGGSTTSDQPSSTNSPGATSTTSSTTTTTIATPTTTKTTTTANTATTTIVNVQTKYNYRELLYKSILFFEAQRSGDLPPTNRISYRGDSSLNDKGEFGEDLSGGWHDAGDHVKFNFPMASSTTLLALSLYLYGDAYNNAGELSNMYDSIKWPLDYFLKCWRDPDRYYATVANPYADHAYWGRPEDMTMDRPAYYVDASKPGSDVAAETASAMAAGALAFANYNTAFSNALRQKAESLYNFAKNNRGLYSSSIPIVNEFYSSGDDKDELCLSAALLYMLTGSTPYLDDAISYHPDYTAWSLSWDEKTVLCQVLLMNITGTGTYKTRVNSFLNNYINGVNPGKTACGLSYRLQWGSLRYAANAAYIALLAADTGLFTQSQSDAFKTYAMSQIHYALGDNKHNRSYVVGFGNNPPVRPHHRAASCPTSGSCGFSYLYTQDHNPHIVYGALVGGPDNNDEYVDDRSNFQRNEVACDYNAGFQSAIAALQSLAIRGKLPPAPSKPQSCH